MKILVIKHGAFGDIVLAFPAFAAIRAAHPKARITLLTTKPYAGLLGKSPWFDRIEVDTKPEAWNLPGLLRLRRQLRGLDRVYDLQTSGRSSRYFALAGRPEWSGIAKGCALPHRDPNRDHIHTRERLAGQLRDAGIETLPVPDLSWLAGDTSGFNLPLDYAVLVPGAAPHRPEKRFPAEKFREVAAGLGLPVVVVGTAGEGDLARIIGGIDLTGRTDFFQLASVLRGAKLAIGNDTGPMHLAAAVGAHCISLFSAASDPALTAPRTPDGGWPTILRAANLQDLPVAQVLAALP
ncbi:glycosyltransferase family 9 protein [Acidocella aromatica]|uniref:ADP-heptose:LPS heptosyltransferase n=1 Tax=Acidocella aromatica TaxID=1303579 RepID=A0A840VLB5_9PROT|nr:ADP-heptose:LPS heptosyltransferase [Acidocella aromatica]